MSLLDIIVLLVLVLTVVRGLMRGMIDTLFSLVAWILAFLLAKWGALMVAPLLPIGVENPAIRYFAGYAVIFLVVLIGVLLLGHALASLVKALPLTIRSTRPIKEAVITSGGVSTEQIDDKTMQSTLCDGLFFAGEVIDVDGPCGGYNLQIAWSTGAIAGRSAAKG